MRRCRPSRCAAVVVRLGGARAPPRPHLSSVRPEDVILRPPRTPTRGEQSSAATVRRRPGSGPAGGEGVADEDRVTPGAADGHTRQKGTRRRNAFSDTQEVGPGAARPRGGGHGRCGGRARVCLCLDGTLTLLGSTPVGATGGVGAVDARLGPDGHILWVDESRIGAVGAFAVNGGTLTELASSPTSLPAGAAPAGIVVT